MVLFCESGLCSWGANLRKSAKLHDKSHFYAEVEILECKRELEGGGEANVLLYLERKSEVYTLVVTH